MTPHCPPPVPPLSHRSGSALERRAITPPVGSPVGRPLYVPPEKTALSLDKIAKRECKVLVVAPVQGKGQWGGKKGDKVKGGGGDGDVRPPPSMPP